MFGSSISILGIQFLTTDKTKDNFVAYNHIVMVLLNIKANYIGVLMAYIPGFDRQKIEKDTGYATATYPRVY